MKIVEANSTAPRIEAFLVPEGLLLIETLADYADPALPADVAAEISDRATRTVADAEARAAFEADLHSAKEAEFAAFKARGGAPSYKAGAVKIAADKLAVTEVIETAIMGLVNTAGDKTLMIWWQEAPTISQGDAPWQEIEPIVLWPKDVVANDLFALAATI